MESALRSIVIDCARPAALARFWADVLGYQVRPYDEAEVARLHAMGVHDLEDDPTVVIDPVDGPGPTVFFTKVPEPKSAKNRVHLDVALSRADVERLGGLGAAILREVDEDGRRWTVMADPEGNEFCAVHE